MRTTRASAVYQALSKWPLPSRLSSHLGASSSSLLSAWYGRRLSRQDHPCPTSYTTSSSTISRTGIGLSSPLRWARALARQATGESTWHGSRSHRRAHEPIQRKESRGPAALAQDVGRHAGRNYLRLRQRRTLGSAGIP